MNKKSTLPLIVGLLVLCLLGYLAWRYSYVLSSSDDMMSLVRGLALLLFIAPAAMAYRSSSDFLRHLSIWMGIGFCLAIGFSYQGELQNVWERLSGQMSPSSGSTHADGSVVFMRGVDGHFHVDALVNGVTVRFLVDTGASHITLTASDAKRLGIDPDALTYDMLSQTANGNLFMAHTTVNVIKVGPIEAYTIPAAVNRNMTGQSLLGMSFLNKLKKYSIEGNKLTLAN